MAEEDKHNWIHNSTVSLDLTPSNIDCFMVIGSAGSESYYVFTDANMSIFNATGHYQSSHTLENHSLGSGTDRMCAVAANVTTGTPDTILYTAVSYDTVNNHTIYEYNSTGSLLRDRNISKTDWASIRGLMVNETGALSGIFVYLDNSFSEGGNDRILHLNYSDLTDELHNTTTGNTLKRFSGWMNVSRMYNVHSVTVVHSSYGEESSYTAPNIFEYSYPDNITSGKELETQSMCIPDYYDYHDSDIYYINDMVYLTDGSNFMKFQRATGGGIETFNMTTPFNSVASNTSNLIDIEYYEDGLPYFNLTATSADSKNIYYTVAYDRPDYTIYNKFVDPFCQWGCYNQTGYFSNGTTVEWHYNGSMYPVADYGQISKTYVSVADAGGYMDIGCSLKYNTAPTKVKYKTIVSSSSGGGGTESEEEPPPDNFTAPPMGGGSAANLQMALSESRTQAAQAVEAVKTTLPGALQPQFEAFMLSPLSRNIPLTAFNLLLLAAAGWFSLKTLNRKRKTPGDYAIIATVGLLAGITVLITAPDIVVAAVLGGMG